MTPDIVRRGPLEGRALPATGAVRAVVPPFATRFILQGEAAALAVLAPAFGVAPPARPLSSSSEGARTALWLGPDEWLLIAEDEPAGLGQALEAALAGVFHALVDVSSRQTALELSGRGAARALNYGVPLDLDISAFPIGAVMRTLFVKAEISLWRREAERFRVEVARSFAAYVAAVLKEAAEGQG